MCELFLQILIIKLPNLGRVCLIFTKIAFLAELSTINAITDGEMPEFGKKLLKFVIVNN